MTFKISSIDEKNKRNEQENRITEWENEVRLIGFKEVNSFFLKVFRILLDNEANISNIKGTILKFEFDGLIHAYIDIFDTINDLDRINQIGKLIKLGNIKADNIESENLLIEFTNLMNDLRIDMIKKNINSQPLKDGNKLPLKG